MIGGCIFVKKNMNIQKFNVIKNEVEESINQLFDYIKKNSLDENDFYLIILQAEHFTHSCLKEGNPYFIQFKLDIDKDKIDFYLNYLNTFYNNFENLLNNNKTYNLTIELMIYTHIWESKNFIKKLKRLQILSSKEEYNWNIEITFNKKELIKDILENFETNNLKISEIIKKGYDRELRNAFAHSDFSFDFNNYKIYYNIKNYIVKNEIKFDDWREKFFYSVLLEHCLLNMLEDEKDKMQSLFPIKIFLRKKDGEKINAYLTKYNKETNNFDYNLI